MTAHREITWRKYIQAENMKYTGWVVGICNSERQLCYDLKDMLLLYNLNPKSLFQAGKSSQSSQSAEPQAPVKEGNLVPKFGPAHKPGRAR